MGIIKHKKYIFAICLLVLDRINFADSNHLLFPGRTTGRIVGIQDRVLESCRGHFMCEAFPFRGSYGLTCINGNLLCDGIRHCRDGSDELPISCPGRGGGASIGGVGVGQVELFTESKPYIGDNVVLPLGIPNCPELEGRRAPASYPYYQLSW